MGSKVFEGVSYYLAEKSMQEPAEVGHRPRHVGLVVPTGTLHHCTYGPCIWPDAFDGGVLSITQVIHIEFVVRGLHLGSLIMNQI